jgi:hypothetical protein
MNNVWVQSANNFMLREVSTQKQLLPKGVYKFQLDQFENPYLAQVQEEFVFPYKIYGVETDFVDRVICSWKHTTGNFGVLLNGLKGTGKTVTAELIANQLGLPVIIVSFHSAKLISFLNEIQQDVVVFVDEFEKIYDGYENSLLTIMDGALKTRHRLFFLLTTNELRVDKNLLQRPSRVRYVKTFSDLTLPVIMEVVKDKLVHDHWYDATVKFISELPIITMDLVKSVVEEVNIHDESPENFKDVFNIHADKTDMYNVYKLVDGEKQEVNTYVNVYPDYITEYSVNSNLHINHRHVGIITKVISEDQFVIKEYDENTDQHTDEVVYIREKAVRTHLSFVNSGLVF